MNTIHKCWNERIMREQKAASTYDMHNFQEDIKSQLNQARNKSLAMTFIKGSKPMLQESTEFEIKDNS